MLKFSFGRHRKMLRSAAAVSSLSLIFSLLSGVGPASASGTCLVSLDDSSQTDTQQIAAIQAALGGSSTCTVVELVTPVGSPVEVFFDPAADHLSTRRPLNIVAIQETVTFKRNAAPNTVRQYGGFIAGLFAGATATGTLRLENLSFEGGEAALGGAVYSEDQMHLVQTRFIGNSSGTHGGAVYSKNSITIEGSVFEQNTTTGSGGAVYTQNGSVQARSSQFTENSSAAGGAVRASGNSAITDVTFTKNQARAGGAFWLHNNLSATDTNFVENVAEYNAGIGPDGGAAVVGGDFTMVRGSIVDNVANFTGSGRAGRAGGVMVFGEAFLTDVDVRGNTSTNFAGALYVQGRATVSGGRFIQNRSWQAGGAIYSEDGFDISGTQFVDNSSQAYSGYLRAQGPSTITDSFFRSNRSPGPGVLIARPGNTTVVSSAIHNLTVERSTFHENISTTNGPAVRALAEVHIFGSSFTQNRMTGSGTGAAVWARGVYASMSSFIDNTSSQGQSQQIWATEVVDNPEPSAQREVALQGVIISQTASEPLAIDLGGGNLVDLGGNVLSTTDSGFGTDSRTSVSAEELKLSNFEILNSQFSQYGHPGIYADDAGAAAGAASKQQILDVAANTALPATFRTLITDVTGSTQRFVDLEGNSLDSLSLKAGALQTSFTRNAIVPPSYFGPVVTAASTSRPAAGSTLELMGERLDGVSRVSIGGAEAEILAVTPERIEVRVSANAQPGSSALTLVSSMGQLNVQSLIVVQAGAEALAELTSAGHGYTRFIGDHSLKVYARDIVGVGKVQFFLNGREIAWVRAADANDPKLNVRSAAGEPSYGMVRTVTADVGRNVLEIHVEGERVVRRIYTR